MIQYGVVRCSVVQCVAMWCRVFPRCCCQSNLPPSMVLQCAAVCCSVLQCVAVCCSVLQCVAVYCSVSQCVAVCRSVLQCVAVCVVVCVVVCAAVHCSALQSSLPRSMVLHSFSAIFTPSLTHTNTCQHAHTSQKVSRQAGVPPVIVTNSSFGLPSAADARNEKQ